MEYTRTKWKFPVLGFFASLLLLLGVLVLLFPTATAWLTQYEQSTRIVEATEKVEDLPSQARLNALAAAEAYNEALQGGNVRVAPGERFPLADGQGSAADYSSLLKADSRGLMGRLKIPKINADLPIYHGTSDHILSLGVGHLEGSALPIGGAGNHSVLTGHRGLATAEMFTNLDKVEKGDTFTIELFGEVLTYRVFDKQVVKPEDTQILNPVPGRDLVTLVTCTPLGINSHRILVTAERITPTPQADVDAAGEPPEVPGFPWWMYGVAAAVILAGLFVWHSGRGTKKPVEPANQNLDAGSESLDGPREEAQPVEA